MLYGEALKIPAQDHPADAKYRVVDWDTGKFMGEIPQVSHTYAYVGGAYYGGINEHQVGVGETTFGGVPSLQHQPNGMLAYTSLMQLALQRSKTAREAIRVITDLTQAHGYASEGESFTVADAHEAWILELIGKGEAELGAVWVARRIPDGHVSGHANQARITTFPRDDPDNCMYAPDVVRFAVSMGLYPADAPEADFDFAAAYHPITFTGARASDARVYDFFARVSDADFAARFLPYAMGADLHSGRLPLSIAPAHPVALNDTFWATRSKYEGTPMAMTDDVGAGGFATAFRALPLFWDKTGAAATPVGTGAVALGGAPADEEPLFFHERPAATQQTGWHFVAQLRSWLPDAVGGVIWFGVDDTSLSPRTAIHVGSLTVPPAFTSAPAPGVVSDAASFSLHSAWWVHNLVANLAYAQYAYIAPQVHAAIVAHEAHALKRAALVEAQAVELLKAKDGATDGASDDDASEAVARLLTEHAVSSGQELLAKWTKLFEVIFTQHRDGAIFKRAPAPPADSGDQCALTSHVGASTGRACLVAGYREGKSWKSFPGYVRKWYAHVVANTADRFRIPAGNLMANAPPADGRGALAGGGPWRVSAVRQQSILEGGSGRDAYASHGASAAQAAGASANVGAMDDAAQAWRIVLSTVGAPAATRAGGSLDDAETSASPNAAAAATPWWAFVLVFVAGAAVGGALIGIVVPRLGKMPTLGAGDGQLGGPWARVGVEVVASEEEATPYVQYKY